MSAWDGAQWVGRAARPVDVGHLVDEIVGLSRQQFLQVILLAQGRFARFLLARNDERQRLLRSLFDTKRFEDYEQELAERSRAARERIDDGERDLVARLEHAEGLGAEARSDEPSGGETDEGSGDRVDGGVADEARDDAVDPASLTLARRIARVRRAAERARVVADARSEAEREAAGRREAARRAHDERAARRDRQVRRDATRDRLTALRAREDEIAQLRGEGEAATRAEGVRGAVAERARAERARAEAASQRERALAAWEEVGDGQADAPDDLDAFAAGAQNRVGAWEERRRTEEGLADAERSLETLRQEERDARAESAALAERVAALPAETAALREEREAALAAASGAETHAERVRALEAQAAGAALREERRREHAGVRERLDAALRSKNHADAALTALHEARFADIAGELADSLAEGTPCAVCGSTEHPAPAVRTGEPVTPEAIEEARAACERALVDYDAADGALAEAQRLLDEAVAAGAGREAAAIDDELAAARRTVAEAEAAGARAGELAERIAALVAQSDRSDAERSELEGHLTRLAERIASAARTLAADREAVERDRGGFGTVAERIAHERRRAGAATTAAAAQREHARADAAARDAAERLAVVVADAGFADADAAEAALRDPARRAELSETLTGHDAAVRSAGDALAELESDALPDEPIDVTAARAAAEAAERAWEAALRSATDATRLADALAAAAEAAEAAHERIAALAAESEVVRRLADTVAGRPPNARRMKLERFVLAAELEEIVRAANIRLAEMSADRYRLRHSDALAAHGAASGLGIDVMDRFTGRARPPQSLSGGETFLASLALALGLAEVVTSRSGGMRLDTLFIDEGFGSLDGDTLEVAMRTLDALRQGGRTVGVISHVEAMKEQIPAQLRVDRTPQGWSTVTAS